jgi:bile-acid 7alpha-dehydratase
MKETDLEKRIRILEDIEAIKKVKAKYWYCLERRLWDELPDVFAKDVIDYAGEGVIGCQGKKDVVKHLVDLLDKGGVNLHRGHSPMIEITGETTAIGKWDLYLYMEFDPQAKRGQEGWGSYEDEYVKEKGKWKIKSWRYIPARLEQWNKVG